jgi:hypothetical protein
MGQRKATDPASKISGPRSSEAAKDAAKRAQKDPRFHYGVWFQRQQQQQAAARNGRPQTQPTTPVAAQEPAGRSAKRINIPKKAWGDPTIAPMSVDLAADEMEGVVRHKEENMRGGRARVMRFSRADDDDVPTQQKQDAVQQLPAAAANATAVPAMGRSLKSVQHGLTTDTAKPFTLKTAVAVSAKAIKVAKAALTRASKASARANESRSTKFVMNEHKDAHRRKAKMAKYEQEHEAKHHADKSAVKAAAAEHQEHHTHHHKHKKAAAAAGAGAAAAAGVSSGAAVIAGAGKDVTATPVGVAAATKLSPAPIFKQSGIRAEVEAVPEPDAKAAPASEVKAKIKAVPQPMEPVLSKEFVKKQEQQQQQVHEESKDANQAPNSDDIAVDSEFEVDSDSSSAEGSEGSASSREVVIGKPPAAASAQALLLPADLTLVKADGSAVPDATVAAFRYVWQLLQGRLMMGDPSTLLMFQPGWAGGWLAPERAV